MPSLLNNVNATLMNNSGASSVSEAPKSFLNDYKVEVLLTGISLAFLLVACPLAGAIAAGVVGLGLAGFAIESKLTEKKTGDVAARVFTPERERVEQKPFEVDTYPRISQYGESLLVTVPIAGCRNLRLSNESLGEVFGLINKHTFMGAYAMPDTSIRKVDGVLNIRAIGSTLLNHNNDNYNGVREAIKTRVLEAAFDSIKAEGTEEAKRVLGTFSDQEIVNLKLARYLYTSGAVQEISLAKSQPDNFHIRSAEIYRAYAEQLGISPETIAWTARFIETAQPFLEQLEPVNTGDEKFDLACELFRAVDVLDSGRCFPENTMDVAARKMEDRLGSIFSNPRSAVQGLRNYTERMQVETDPHRNFIRGTKSEIANEIFREFSMDGKFCWSGLKRQLALNSVPF